MKNRLVQKWALIFGLVVTCLPAFAQESPPASTRPAARAGFVHPGIPFTAADLDELKVNVNKAPWSLGFKALAADSHSSLDYKMQGPFESVTRSPHVNRNQWMNDMQAVHNLTFMWVFTDNAQYAQKATDILNAWAVTNTAWGGDEAILDLGDWVHCYATAADILQSTYPGWTAQNAKNVRNYFTNVLWPQLDVPNPVRGANQGALAIRAATGIAAFLDDNTKWEHALASLRHDPAGGIANSLSNGQLGDFGRDEGHSAGQLGGLAWAAEVAWKQGVDVYADLDNRLHTASELYAHYNFEPGGSQFIPFGNPYGYYTKWGWAGGARRKTPMYNLIHGAYVLRKGMSAPWTVRLRDEVEESKETFLFRKVSDNSTATALPGLVRPIATPAESLSANDVGEVVAAGSANHAGGTWTVSGSGAIAIPASANDAFNFAYRKISGDVVIIARVTAVQNTSPEARAGLMIRESLAKDARHVGIFLMPAMGARATWRGATAFCKTDTSWAISTQTPRNFEEHAGPVAPHWLKLERLGTRVTVYHSLDASNWTCLENVELPITDAAYVGLCVSSGDPAVLNTSTFTGVSITPGPVEGAR